MITSGEPLKVDKVSVNEISTSPVKTELAIALYRILTDPGEYSPINSIPTIPSNSMLKLSSCNKSAKFSCNKKFVSGLSMNVKHVLPLPEK